MYEEVMLLENYSGKHRAAVSEYFAEFTEDEILEFAKFLPVEKKGVMLVDALVNNGLAESKKKAREFISQGAITINGIKVSDDVELKQTAIVKKGKNKFLVVK